MYNLIRFYNQNRKQILRVILIIVFIIGIIQLLNLLEKNNANRSENNINTGVSSNTYTEIVSDKSLISGESISTTKLKNDLETIEEFADYCNETNYELAYDLLSEDCKEVMFPTIQDFYDTYYTVVFGNGRKSYTVENWSGNTYQVRYTEDILSSGKLDDGITLQDYITITKEDGENKINVNSYIGRKESNKLTNIKNIKITVTNIDTYMDYEIYNLSIENDSENDILLDTSNDPQSIYLLDKKDIKYYFYNAEIIQNKLLIKSQFTNNLQIKFNNSYSSSRTIKNLVFSRLVLNYDQYRELENKEEYDFYQYGVNL